MRLRAPPPWACTRSGVLPAPRKSPTPSPSCCRMAPASSQAVPWSPTAAIPRGDWVVRRRSGYPHNRLINPPQPGANAMNKQSNLEANLSHWAPHALSLLDLVTVLLFVLHTTPTLLYRKYDR